MKIVYKAANTSEAHIVAGLLISRGIEAHVGGHFLQGGVGDLAPMDFANVYVTNDADLSMALEIISLYDEDKIDQDIR